MSNWIAHDEELVEKTEIKNAANAVLLQTTRGFEDHRDLLTSVENKWDPAGTPVVKSRYTYTNDRLARRTSVLTEGTAFSLPSPHTAAYNRYGYNDRNELTTAYRYLGDDLEDTDDPVPNEHFKYDYDPIGNRRGSWMGPEGEDPIISTDYGAPSGVANSLNQYDRVSSTAGEGTQAISNWVEHDEDGNLSLKWLVGDMNCDGQVNVLDTNAFNLALSDPAAYAAQYPNCQIINADVNNDGYINILDITPYVYLILSGNSGGYTRYVWDAENRLIEVRPAAEEDVLADGITRSEYAYDYLGRRVIKRVYTWDATEDEWNLTLDRRFVYDGWLLLLELDGTVAQPPPAVIRKYTWGLDLAGLNGAVGPVSNRSTDDGRSSAGGIGGLLAMEQASGVQSGYSGGYLFCYDANGNVTQVLDADTGAIAVKYEYDPYGKRVNAPTSGELIQPMTFSTRSFDAETGFGAWLYRLYDPRAGRWISRDPIGETDGAHLYTFVHGSPIVLVDAHGRNAQSGRACCKYKDSGEYEYGGGTFTLRRSLDDACFIEEPCPAGSQSPESCCKASCSRERDWSDYFLGEPERWFQRRLVAAHFGSCCTCTVSVVRDPLRFTIDGVFSPLNPCYTHHWLVIQCPTSTHTVDFYNSDRTNPLWGPGVINPQPGFAATPVPPALVVSAKVVSCEDATNLLDAINGETPGTYCFPCRQCRSLGLQWLQDAPAFRECHSIVGPR
ncbi:tRNA(Glu)-specific nuclease WapA precursor [Phycisphaerae bacterium RAS1]|nr:tRNA(Glu)-specific nuclease WapA precursor [Phycisphaerae bacterium RAS1]